MAQDLGATPFYKRTVGAVDGISAKSYSAETSVDVQYGQDEAGENIAVNTRNRKVAHSWEGQVTGAAPANICLEIPGQAIATPPSGLWESNLDTGEGVGPLFATGARYQETAGESATFGLDAERQAMLAAAA